MIVWRLFIGVKCFLVILLVGEFVLRGVRVGCFRDFGYFSLFFFKVGRGFVGSEGVVFVGEDVCWGDFFGFRGNGFRFLVFG